LRRQDLELESPTLLTVKRKKKNVSAETVLATALRRARLSGWRRHLPLPGRPEFTFRSAGVVIFIEGCRTHGCPEHGRTPHRRGAVTSPAVLRQQQRVGVATVVLQISGWTVLRCWEHEVRGSSLRRVIAKIRRAMRLPGLR
jgi:DNA mismatch endonuclease, patch repair protein